MVETTVQNNQPLNYNTQQRFHFIELIIQWEGRLTTNHLQQHFGISQPHFLLLSESI